MNLEHSLLVNVIQTIALNILEVESADGYAQHGLQYVRQILHGMLRTALSPNGHEVGRFGRHVRMSKVSNCSNPRLNHTEKPTYCFRASISSRDRRIIHYCNYTLGGERHYAGVHAIVVILQLPIPSHTGYPEAFAAELE